MSRSVFFLAVLAFAAAVHAQTLYKWTDAQGRIQYSDRAPKDFKGEVTRIEPDAQPDPPPIPLKPAPAKVEGAEKAVEKPSGDMAAKRRALREKLAADVTRARDKLESARKGLENADGPQVDERQVVQQRYRKGTQPGTPRSNCREVVGADGKKGLMCPALVPNDGYYERIRQLEEAVRVAEEELEEAQRAYRRGVD